VHRVKSSVSVVLFLLAALSAVGQQSTTQPATGNSGQGPGPTTIRGCLTRDHGSYIVTENQSNLVYVLKGVGHKLNGQLHKQVEVTGQTQPGTIKTGVRSEKAGSNPSDTVHGVSGLPLQVADVADVKTIANKCKAADQQ
jgi:hypothetical protein